MICPFMKETMTHRTEFKTITKEWFGDCYETECPYYTIKDGTEICRQTEEKTDEHNTERD